MLFDEYEDVYNSNNMYDWRDGFSNVS